MLAIQTEVSDGTLEIINVGILYLERDNISVYLSTAPSTALVDGVDYQWTSDTSIEFLTGPVPNGVTVRLVRITDSAAMLNIYDGGAPFARDTLDENFNQLLFLTQEFTEGVGLGNLETNLDMNGNAITELGNGTLPTDAINLGQMTAALAKTLRTPDNIAALVDVAAARANKLASFNASGDLVAVLPSDDSATFLETRLANFSDLTLGANMVGRAVAVIPSVAALATIDGKFDGEVVFVRSYSTTYPDLGGGHMIWDADSVEASDFGQIFPGLGATGRWKRPAKGVVQVTDWGAINNGDPAGAVQNANNLAFAAARNYVAATLAKLEFQAGTYTYSVSPNWGIQDAHIEPVGEVRLRYFGTGHAVVFDAGATPATDVLFNVRFGTGNQFHIESPSTALEAVYVRSVHHSLLGLNIHGSGTGLAALLVEFAVCTQFNLTVSVNEGGWYGAAKPEYGVRLSQRAFGETASYCYFPNHIIEGTSVGVWLEHTLGNVFVGGTSEGCSVYGVLGSADTSRHDRFYNCDFEVNTVADFFCNGFGTVFDKCDSYSNAVFGASANRCQIIGGEYQTILFDSGSEACLVRDAVYNRFATSGTFSDAGTGSTVDNLRSGVATFPMWGVGTAAYDPPSMAAGTSTTTAVMIPGSVPGDFCVVSFTTSTSGAAMTAQVVVAGQALVTLQNISGAPLDLAPGTLRVRVIRGF